MENKTNISALEELVNSEIRNYEKNHTEIDNDILQQNIWMTVDSTCDPEEALKWYNEEINGFVYIQLVDHNSMLIEVLKCNF